MSFGFELDTRGQRELQGYMQQNVATPEQIDENAGPGMFAGTGGLFMSELAAAGRSVAIAGGAIPAAIDAVVGDDNQGRPLADRYFDAVDDVTKSAVEYWKPSPAATGAAGRVLGPVAGGLVQLAATGGNPSLMMLRQQLGTAVELVDQGVDATTAQIVGGAQGIAAAAGFKLGTVGKSLGLQMASGGAGNLATNVPAAAVSQAVLEQGGYYEQAKQFNPFDLEARAIDVLMGAAFGAVAHYGPKPADAAVTGETPPQQTRLLPEERAALLTASSARNWDESAPGRPASDVDLAMHNNAMSAALEQMMRNEPVDVASHIEGAAFAPRETSGVELINTMRKEFGDEFEQPAPVADTTRADAPTTIAEPDTTTPSQADGKSRLAVGKTAAAEDPEIAAARAAIERQPEGAMIDLGDEDNPMIVDVRQAWQQVEAEMQQAKKEAEGFMAAVTCYLGA